MQKLRFKNFLEIADFGFKKRDVQRSDDTPDTPVRTFNLELMTEYLTQKLIQQKPGVSSFVGSVRWESGPGAVKLEVDPGLTAFIRRLIFDKSGLPVWITKKVIQLDRQGMGGSEEKIAQELFEVVKTVFWEKLDTPGEIESLSSLVVYLERQIGYSASSVFVPAGKKKINDNTYIIKMELRGSGTGAPNQMQIRQNQVLVQYKPDRGLIRIMNYNIGISPNNAATWKTGLNDFECYFTPTQSKSDIAEAIVTHLHYY